MNIKLSFLVTSLIGLSISGSIFGQEAYFLDLQGPGTATVFVSSDDKTAYITDGGKSGDRGIMGARINGLPILEFLESRAIERIVVTCSHPHSDHLDGLIEMVKDEKMLNFKDVQFVDSAYLEKESLHELYKRNWGEDKSKNSHYQSADNRNAFAFKSSVEANVIAENFVYEGKGEHPHGHCVIMQYTLRRGGRTHRIVDFDDADSWQVKLFADWVKESPASRRPETILLPHHGSSRTDINPLLEESIRPKSAIISVNRKNQYRHPGPATLLTILNKLGPENVHFSSSRGNVQFNEFGIAAEIEQANHQRVYEMFIAENHLDVELEYLTLIQKSNSEPLTESELKKIGVLEQTRKEYIAIRKRMSPEILNSDEHRNASTNKSHSETSNDRSISSFLVPDNPVVPELFYEEIRAEKEMATDSIVGSKLAEMDRTIRTKGLKDAVLIAKALMNYDEGGLSPLEEQTCQFAESAVDLLNYLSGQPFDKLDSALNWPDLSNDVGTRSLQNLTKSELYKVLTSGGTISPMQLRTLGRAIAKCSEINPSFNEFQVEIAFRLLLQGEPLAAESVLPSHIDSEVARRIVNDVKALVMGSDQTSTWAAKTTLEAKELSNPLFPSVTVSTPRTRELDVDLLQRLSSSLSSYSLEGIEISEEARKLETAMLARIESHSALRSVEEKVIEKIQEMAEKSIGDRLLVSELTDICENYLEGRGITEVIKDIIEKRELIIRSASAKSQLATREMKVKDALPHQLSIRNLATLQYKDLGITERHVSRWKSNQEKSSNTHFSATNPHQVYPGGLGRLPMPPKTPLLTPGELRRITEKSMISSRKSTYWRARRR